MWGSSHLLINLTNLTLGVRKFPRLSDTILFGMVSKVYVCYLSPKPPFCKGGLVLHKNQVCYLPPPSCEGA